MEKILARGIRKIDQLAVPSGIDDAGAVLRMCVSTPGESHSAQSVFCPMGWITESLMQSTVGQTDKETFSLSSFAIDTLTGRKKELDAR